MDFGFGHSVCAALLALDSGLSFGFEIGMWTELCLFSFCCHWGCLGGLLLWIISWTWDSRLFGACVTSSFTHCLFEVLFVPAATWPFQPSCHLYLLSTAILFLTCCTHLLDSAILSLPCCPHLLDSPTRLHHLVTHLLHSAIGLHHPVTHLLVTPLM